MDTTISCDSCDGRGSDLCRTCEVNDGRKTDKYIVKDSGQRRVFSTGAQRDRGDMKPRPDLIHPYFLFRLGLHLAKGAEKYDEWNWTKGMPVSEFFASAYRHLIQARAGDEDEDHLSAVAFNVMGAMIMKAGVEAGIYPEELGEMPNLQAWAPYLMVKNFNRDAQVSDQKGERE